MISLPVLEKGDVIRILAPAKAIEKEVVDFAVESLEGYGFNVQVSDNCLGRDGYFSGTIAERTADLQSAIDDAEVKAIICARGGYGCIQIVDRVNWAGYLTHPKWVIGFSDITVLHQHLSRMKSSSIHASMPLNYRENSERSLDTMVKSLLGEQLNYSWAPNRDNKTGITHGELIGGNLSVLCGLIGTNEMPSYLNSILFVEDVGEHLYAIDRCFHQLSKAGILDQIRGLVLGGFTDSKDTDPPYGKTFEEIICTHFEYRSIPVAFDFPAGHQDDNCPLILGNRAVLSVEDGEVSLKM
jgi:muramoyltetrapeptide carboxypeptidase